MPAAHPDPPYEYPNVDLHLLQYPLRGEQVRQLVPPPLTAPEGEEQTCFCGLARYRESTLGAYDEIFWLVPACHGALPGLYCPLTYVNSDTALAAYRGALAWPAELAVIAWTDVPGGKRQVAASRRGTPLLSIRVETTETYPAADPPPAPLPVFGLRPHPDHEPGTAAPPRVIVTVPEDRPTAQALGLASVRLLAPDLARSLAPPDPRVPLAYVMGAVSLTPRE